MDKKLISIYQKTTKENLRNIDSILKSIGIRKKDILPTYRKILDLSAGKITNKWLSEEKYCRTYFVKKAFRNLYPEKHTKLSLTIDAMVNILDDLLDESLKEKEKEIYVIEFLRVFSIYNKEVFSKDISQMLSDYLEKLITLAVAEKVYQKQISLEKNIKTIANKSAELLICRGMDIDIFVSIALLKYKKWKTADLIKKIARIFRAIDILKKDIKDIKHDKENKIKTIITLLLEKKRIDFSQYISLLLDLLTEKIEQELEGYDLSAHKSHPQFQPVYNFYRLIEQEKKEVNNLSQKQKIVSL